MSDVRALIIMGVLGVLAERLDRELGEVRQRLALLERDAEPGHGPAPRPWWAFWRNP